MHEQDTAERRFGALRTLHGDEGYERLRSLNVAVVGLGGVGSWTVEALARSGVAGLILIDFDHVAESNVNRQVQASGRTLGQGKGQALAERIADIHPGCQVRLVDEFVAPGNWPALLPCAIDGLVDACDQARAKVALAAWALREQVPFISVGAAGGKQQPQRVEVGDLATVTHDPLLSSVRQQLRKVHGAARHGPMGLQAVFSREPVLPAQQQAGEAGAPLACRGYGSTVTVTATFGFVAAGQIMQACMAQRARSGGLSERAC